MNQTEFPATGGQSKNLAITSFKGVKVQLVVTKIREYVESMHRLGHPIHLIRIKRDDLESILRELNKGRPDNAAPFVSVHWDGAPITA